MSRSSPQQTDDDEPELEQPSLFDDLQPSWAEHWQSMPEYDQRDKEPWQTVKVHFRNREDRTAFAGLVGQRLTDASRWMWFPKLQTVPYYDKQYEAADDRCTPRYPVYIVSKGRWDSRLTSKALEAMRVPYHIVVEPQERENYAAVIDPAKVLVLPFSNLGQGSIPARNWIWTHAAEQGHARHWILDDNITDFFRLNRNLKVPVADGAIFRAAEDFADRYVNVAIAGFNYEMFAKRKQRIPPFVLNTRIYSCILIRNDIPFRWRGRYNEDTDLSLRALKQGMCTVQFNAFLARKVASMYMPGGNTDELYADDGRLQMAQALQDLHPDCVTVSRKYGRWQHHVDYRRFKANKLVLKPGTVIPKGQDDYGMALKMLQCG